MFIDPDESRKAAEAGLAYRAVISSDVAFTISDPHQPDHPLVWVNPAFERITGYAGRDVLGTNCRFLQGPDTDQATISRIAQKLRDGGPFTEVLLNYRKDGSSFWNHLAISPVFDADGRLTHHVGIQSDMTAQVEADATRAEALVAAEHALREAQIANGRLTALATISQSLATRIDTGAQVAEVLPTVIAASIPGWVVLAALDDALEEARGNAWNRGNAWTGSRHREATIDTISVAHSDPALAAAASAAQRALSAQVQTNGARAVLAATAHLGPGVVPISLTISRDRAAILGFPREVLDTIGPAGLGIAITALTARSTLVGLLLLARDAQHPYDRNDLLAIGDLGVRAGVALDNARLYAREHEAALTLQRSLLPPLLPDLPGFDVAAAYRPAEGRAEVGGDWYDVTDLPGAGIGVAVGDVMGHDLNAAATMGQLRSVLRACAWNGDQPAVVLNRLDEIIRGLGLKTMATCAYAVISHNSDGCVITYTLAGHLPPMLRHVDGHVERLTEGLTPPVGLGGPHRGEQASTGFPAGSSLVLYTDGLIERRDQDIDTSLAALAAAIEGAAPDASAQELCDHLLAALHSDDHDDDTCILVLQNRPVGSPAATA